MAFFSNFSISSLCFLKFASICPKEAPSNPASSNGATAAAYAGTSLDTLYTNYMGAQANPAIRVYPDTNVGFNNNGFAGVLSDSGTGQYYFNAVKAALADHSVIL